MQKNVEFPINKSVLILANLFLKHLLILVLWILSKQHNNQYLPKSLIMKVIKLLKGILFRETYFSICPRSHMDIYLRALHKTNIWKIRKQFLPVAQIVPTRNETEFLQAQENTCKDYDT